MSISCAANTTSMSGNTFEKLDLHSCEMTNLLLVRKMFVFCSWHCPFFWRHVLSSAFVVVHVPNKMCGRANINMTNTPRSKCSIAVNPDYLLSINITNDLEMGNSGEKLLCSWYWCDFWNQRGRYSARNSERHKERKWCCLFSPSVIYACWKGSDAVMTAGLQWGL